MDKVYEGQAGFRQGYTTIDNIFIYQSIVQKYLNSRGGKFYALFVDFAKAFDSIKRNKLWDLLQTHGLSNKMNKLLRSIYENVKVCVRNNNEVSETFTCHLGVRQGCILSPFLFTFFINELAVQICDNCSNGIQLHPDLTQLFLLLFADDIVLFSSTIRGLQKEIDQLETYSDEWNLAVNRSKTKVIVFKNGGKLSKREKWIYKGEKLETTNVYKYLGVYFPNHLSWINHTKQASIQALKVLINITRNIHILGDISYKSFFKIFDVKVSPILLYGSEIWGLDNYESIEKVHLYACKKYLGVKSSTCSTIVYGECGRFPLYIYSTIKVIKYWLRLLNMPCHRFPKKCYNMMRIYDKNGKRNWVTNVRELLFKIGYGYVWNNQNAQPENAFIMSLTQRMKDIYQQTWLESVDLSPKCLYYKNWKSELCQEYYLSKITVKKFRVALSRFRCSSHELFVETGRYVNIPRNNRICNICNVNAVEDEYHFLFICPAYENLRKKYLTSYYCDHPNEIKMTTLLSNENTFELHVL